MANTQVFRTYTLAVRARAGLQILNHAIYQVAGEYRDEAELLTKLDAGALMWEAREKILKAAAGRRMASSSQALPRFTSRITAAKSSPPRRW